MVNAFNLLFAARDPNWTGWVYNDFSIFQESLIFFLLFIPKKMNLNPENLYVVCTSLLILLWGFFAVFFFCECGTILTNRFATFDYELWQCNWHLFPFKMQRILPLVMSNTQHPATLYSYGNFECTRDTFKRVICLFFKQIVNSKYSNCFAGIFCRQSKLDFPILRWLTKWTKIPEKLKSERGKSKKHGISQELAQLKRVPLEVVVSF